MNCRASADKGMKRGIGEMQKWGDGKARQPVYVEMQLIPRVGEFLVNGKDGAREVLRVTHTPEETEQSVVIELGPGEAK